ncbi:MAG TPA: hypothetical protein VK488_13085 [Gaiellaceae bacterium]|nr:hypothetical protein [Gaiellaceae bacterium]
MREAAKFVAQAFIVAVITYAVSAIAAGVGLLAGLAATLLTPLSGLDRAVLFVGVALMFYGATAIAANVLIPDEWLRPRRPIKPPSVEQLKSREAEDRERKYRITAQEALTTLRYQRAKLLRGVPPDFDSMHQGAWPQNRNAFFEEEQNANAGRLTEDAFIAIGDVSDARSPTDEAIAAIEAAVPALETVAGVTH